MTIKIHGKDCAFCQLFVADEGDDHDFDCLLRARNHSKDSPGETCPGPGEYALVPVAGQNALVAAVERYEAIEAEYAKYRNRDRVNEPKGTLDEADRLAGLSMRQDKIVREAAIAFVRGLGRKG